jgi:hypothetical protein
LWREQRTGLAGIHEELIAYVEEAFDDARRRIRRGFEDNLSPFRDAPNDPAANYPSLLHRITLQGYFGELLAVLAVEHWGAHGHMDWRVPAFLFRMHEVEFQHLDSINERLRLSSTYDPDLPMEIRPGRTGDDALAFRINLENTITDILVLEAKCVTRNNSTEIKEAHQKLSSSGSLPSGVRELISLLSEYNSPEAQSWQEALLNLWRARSRIAIRHDSVAYACGQRPRRAGRVSWMPTEAPHPDYSVDRNLEGMEFQFEDLTTVVDSVFHRA